MNMSDMTKPIIYKKTTNVLDIFLFIDLIDPICQRCTDDVMHLVSVLNQKTYCHIVPYQTLQSIDTFLKRNQLPANDLCLRNAICQTVYNMSLAYKAANMQGKKKARLFLQQLIAQSTTILTEQSTHCIIEAAKSVEMDIDMLKDDMTSQNVKELYRRDQKMAQQFAIHSTPSLIIFNSCQPNGILLDINTISIDLLEDILMQRYPIEAVR